MDLIKSLQAGYADAPNGTATIYLRGTSTAAGYFADAEGYAPITAGTPITLDSSGRAEVYVNDLVKVEVRNSSGTLIADFVAMDAAPAQEVRSLSMSGVDYESAESAVGNPTTTQAIFDRVKASFGTHDWYVDVNGTRKTLTAAISAISGLFFNVQAPEFGAKGNGTTDDTAAIQAAIDAAKVLGGTVFFPAPSVNYRTISALTLASNVNLLGSTPVECAIVMDHASNNLFAQDTSSSAVAAQNIENLTFSASQANTGAIFPFTEEAGVVFSNCHFGSATFSAPAARLVGTTGGTTSKKVFIDCEFRVSGDFAFHHDSAIAKNAFIRCDFLAKAGARTATFSSPFSAEAIYTDCTFNASAVTSGIFTEIDLSVSANASARITGNQFIGGGGTSVSAGIVTQSMGGALTSVFAESANTFASLDTNILYTLNLAGSPASNFNSSSSRESNFGYATDSTGAVTVNASKFGNFFLDITTATTWTVTLADAYPGARFTLTIRNVPNVTGAIAIVDQDTATGVFGYGGAYAPNVNQINSFSFVYVHSGAGVGSWALCGESTSI